MVLTKKYHSVVGVKMWCPHTKSVRSQGVDLCVMGGGADQAGCYDVGWGCLSGTRLQGERGFYNVGIRS